MANIIRRVGASIRVLRTEKGFSQEDLAAKAKLHRTYIGSVERGERNITITTLERIAKALGVKAFELLRGD